MQAGEPETLRQEILKHRSSITEASRSFSIPAYDGGDEGVTPQPGARTLRFSSADAETPGPDPEDATPTLEDVLLYRNPLLSGVVFLSGLLVLSLGHFLLSGAHGWKLLPTAAQAAMCLLGFNFVRGLLIRGWTGSLAGGPGAVAAADAAAAGVRWLAAAHDAYLTGQDPARSLRVVILLWGLTWAGQVLSVWTTATVVFVAAFTLPVAWTTYEPALAGAATAAREAAASRWQGLGLTRRARAAGVLLVLGGVWAVSGWAARAAGLLAGALAVKSQLRPGELEALATRAEPYTQSVRKQAARFSRAAAGFASSRLGVPSAMKPPRAVN